MIKLEIIQTTKYYRVSHASCLIFHLFVFRYKCGIRERREWNVPVSFVEKETGYVHRAIEIEIASSSPNPSLS